MWAWQDVAGETGYKVQRSANGSTGWAQVGTTGAGETAFSDTGLAAGTEYFYRVLAFNGAGDSVPSAVVDATTAVAVPPAPAGVSAAAVSTSRIDVGWQDVAGETGYKVQRSANGSSGWAQVGTTGAGETAFSDTGLAAGTEYFYRVLAFNGAGDSVPSAVAERDHRGGGAAGAGGGECCCGVHLADRCGLAGRGRRVRVSGGALGQWDHRLGPGGHHRRRRDGVL